MATTPYSQNKQVALEVYRYAELLEKFDIKCYGNKQNPGLDLMSYIIFGNDTDVGYAQYGIFDLWSFSSVHKPCKECGSGIRIFSRVPEKTVDAVLATEAMKTKYTPVIKEEHKEKIIKYKSIQEYIELSIFKPSRIIEEWDL